MEERIRKLFKDIEEEKARIEEMIRDALERIQEIYSVSEEDIRKGFRMFKELRRDVASIKASVSMARGRFRRELRGFRRELARLSKMGEEAGGELSSMLEEADDAVGEFEEAVKAGLEELTDSLGDLRNALRDMLREARHAVSVSVGRRELVLNRGRESMVISSIRLPREDAEMIDLLVEAGIFRSRSEAVSYFAHKGIEASRDLLERVRSKVEELRKIRESLAREFKASQEPA